MTRNKEKVALYLHSVWLPSHPLAMEALSIMEEPHIMGSRYEADALSCLGVF